MSDHRQSVYTVRLGDLSADVRGVAGICALLPPAAATELAGRRASFYASLSAGGGQTTLRLAAIPGAVIHVTRAAKTTRYLIEVWRGRAVNARTIDPDTDTPILSQEVGSLTNGAFAALYPEIAAAMQKRLPGIRSRLSTRGEAYIQVALADGRGLGVRITRKG